QPSVVSGGDPHRCGGGRGIRTPGTLPGTVVFKTTAIDHSAIPPAFASVYHGACFGAQAASKTTENPEVSSKDATNHPASVAGIVLHQPVDDREQARARSASDPHGSRPVGRSGISSAIR